MITIWHCQDIFKNTLRPASAEVAASGRWLSGPDGDSAHGAVAEAAPLAPKTAKAAGAGGGGIV